MSDKSDLYEKGMKTRRSVLGEKYVDAANAKITDLDRDFQKFLTETAWGSVWSNDNITRRERSMITLALLATLGMDDEFAFHLKATARTGATAGDIREVLNHVAIYAGIPKAAHAFKIAKEVYAEMEQSPK